MTLKSPSPTQIERRVGLFVLTTCIIGENFTGEEVDGLLPGKDGKPWMLIPFTRRLIKQLRLTRA